MKHKKISAVLLIGILIANLVLFAMKKISGTIFWVIIAVIFLINWKFYKKKK